MISSKIQIMLQGFFFKIQNSTFLLKKSFFSDIYFNKFNFLKLSCVMSYIIIEECIFAKISTIDKDDGLISISDSNGNITINQLDLKENQASILVIHTLSKDYI